MCIKCIGFAVRPAPAPFVCNEAPPTSKPSRRGFMKASVLAAAAASQAAPALSQTSSDGGQLQRLQTARRLLIKGGVLLSMDRQVGDHASADVLIEDGKIREVRPNIAASDAVIVDAANRIVVPGFI